MRSSPYFICALLATVVGWSCLFAQTEDKVSQPDFKKWDVNYQYGKADTATFTVNEGTWMNLDVRPDGKEIVFDLLGDIYLLPIDGGKAKPLLKGLSYDLQPRFSPDGQWISFTSDRAGGDNIWIMDRKGENLQQVTKEDFRLLNNAVWTSDGNYLIARKHFTSGRSLGAGEMWMYHRSGGKGVQLTKRRNDQQDAGEPEVSPDGRYLFYSEDMSSGGFFQYNKDPNGQIYVIRRLDLQSGELENFITGAGGAMRPQVSPDNQYLAFIRRVRDKTVLFIHKFATGEQWAVYDQLSPDQQETWAIFGVYPNFAWMPDSKEIVIWGNGKINRVSVQNKKSSIIRFEAEVEQSIANAVCFQHEVHPGEFQPKMLRDAVTSPDGKWLVFNAVGYLWKKRLPGGKVERLTTDQQNFEFFPSISPDNKFVAYTTWNDTAMGHLYKVPLSGGKGHRLTTEKSYYYEPSWSADGVMITFRKGRGNSILGFTHAVNPGIYWIAAQGGDANFVIRDGEKPRFNKDRDRIYYFQDGNKKAMNSVTIDGHDQRTHFTSEYATEILLSPDEKWVAFQELYNVYITLAPQTGGALDLSAGNTALPVTRVTRDAGTDLHWSGNSDKLHWMIGPEYFTRQIRNSFTFVEGAPDSLPKPDSSGLAVEFYVASDIPSGELVLEGARIITMRGDEVINNGVIVIDRNRIRAIGRSGEVEIPPAAKRIDLRGKTIMPGMVDVHAHMNHWSGMLSARQNWSYVANVAYGVTTIHDPSASTEMVFSQGEMVRAGYMMGPRIFSTGTILYGAEGDFKAVINSLDDARSHLRRMKAVGALSVKSYNQPRREQRQQVMQAARELQINVYPEGGSTFYHNLNMISDGHTGIEHSIPIAPVHQDVIKFWAASGTGYTPTLNVAYGGLWGENYWYAKTEVWTKQPLMTFTPRAVVDSRSRRRTLVPESEYNHIDNAAVCKDLTDAGVKVNMGSHGQLQGLGSHWEMWAMAQGGMTELEAIRASTLNGAHYIGMGDDIGSLEPGKLADLIVMEKDPLESIYNSETVEYVVLNGRIYQSATMNQVGNHPGTRLPFYWERSGSGDGSSLNMVEGLEHSHCGCQSRP